MIDDDFYRAERRNITVLCPYTTNQFIPNEPTITMNLSVDIKDRHILFLLSILAAVSAVGIVTGYGGTEPSVVGHTPGELAPGTFSSGDYVFPNNLDVSDSLDVGNNLGVGGDLAVTGILQASNVGSVFIRWGNGEAPSETELLYSGYAFNGYHGHASSTTTLCLESGDPGPGTLSDGDLLYVSATGDSSNGRMPPGITSYKAVKCAVCYVQGPSFEIWGTDDCPTGWTAAYKGYAMGSYYTSHATRERHCVDAYEFDYETNHNTGDLWYATSVWSNHPSGLYDDYKQKYLRCAVCIKT